MKRAHDYTLIESSIGGDPAIVVIDAAIDFLGEYLGYAWNVRVWIQCEEVRPNGLPTTEELPKIEKAEDQISQALEANGHSVFFARTTARGKRVLIYRAQNAELADAALQRAIAEGTQAREWSYQIDVDPEFELIEPELSLLASAVRKH